MVKIMISDILDLERIYHRKFIEDQQNLINAHKNAIENLTEEYQVKAEDQRRLVDLEIQALHEQFEEDIRDIEKEDQETLRKIRRRMEIQKERIMESVVLLLHTMGEYTDV